MRFSCFSAFKAERNIPPPPKTCILSRQRQERHFFHPHRLRQVNNGTKCRYLPPILPTPQNHRPCRPPRGGMFVRRTLVSTWFLLPKPPRTPFARVRQKRVPTVPSGVMTLWLPYGRVRSGWVQCPKSPASNVGTWRLGCKTIICYGPALLCFA